MSPSRVVVDGSNIATEGRSLPSLVQLDEAVRAYRDEHPDAEVIVVVDATFAHRIPEAERAMFEEAAAHNELVYPPAGAIGRGDAFLLRIAEKTDAVVLSNDSFQEFHGEHEWLFEKGRLIGGTPVPGVGWIFVPRTPVRGPKSREAVKEAKKTRARIGSKEASQPMPTPKAPPPRARRARGAAAAAAAPVGAGNGKPAEVLKEAIDEALDEAVSSGADGKGGRKRRRRRRSGAAPAVLPTVNEPLTFIQFIAEYQPGAMVEGEIESFASHGAFVVAGDARCYIPLSAMGDPPPRSAREVLARGERRTFVVQALDAPRRGIELALPGFEHVAGRPTEETVEAEIEEAPPPIPARRSRSRKKAAPVALDIPTPEVVEEPPPAKKAAAKKKATGKKAPAAKKAAVKKATLKKAATAKKAPAKKAATKESPAVKKAAAKKAPAKKAAANQTSAKQSVAKKAPAKKAPAKKAPAKKAAAKKTAATKSATKKAPAKKAAAKKSP